MAQYITPGSVYARSRALLMHLLTAGRGSCHAGNHSIILLYSKASALHH